MERVEYSSFCVTSTERNDKLLDSYGKYGNILTCGCVRIKDQSPFIKKLNYFLIYGLPNIKYSHSLPRKLKKNKGKHLWVGI